MVSLMGATAPVLHPEPIDSHVKADPVSGTVQKPDATPENEQGEMKLTLFLVPDGEVHLLARGGAFYVGEVIGLPEAPPDFGSGSDDLIAAGMASMNSPFVPSHATFLEPLD